MQRITGWVKEQLAEIRAGKTREVDRGFVVHGTCANPFTLDATIDPNDRTVGSTHLGTPEGMNSAPAGLARYCSLRSWLSQWSIDDTRADALDTAKTVNAPLLVIENGADDVPPFHCRRLFEVAVTPDKTKALIKGANHYYQGQPEQLAQSISVIHGWLAARGMRMF